MTQFILLPWDSILIRRQDIKSVKVIKVSQGRYAVDVEVFKFNKHETIHIQKNVGDKEDSIELFNQLVEKIMETNNTATLADVKQELIGVKNVYSWLKNKHEQGTPESFELRGGLDALETAIRIVEQYKGGEE